MPTTIQKCVAKGHVLDAVQTRSIFHGEVTYNGADTPSVLWAGYLDRLFDDILNMFVPAWGLDGYDIYELQSGEFVLIDSQSITKVGTAGGTALPNRVAGVVIGKVSGSRSFGRKFLSGMNTGALSGNSWIAGLLAQLVTFTGHWISTYNGLGFGSIVPGIYTKTGVFKPFVSGIVDGLIGSITRRKPGLGI